MASGDGVSKSLGLLKNLDILHLPTGCRYRFFQTSSEVELEGVHLFMQDTGTPLDRLGPLGVPASPTEQVLSF